MKPTRVEAKPESLKETKAKEWVIRFVFGGLVSATAGVVAHFFGPVIGGLFLAFPSILPASLTLVKDHDGRKQASEDARGAAFGSIGLFAFAGVMMATATSWHPVLALAAATAAWLVVSVVTWRVLA